MVIASLGAGRSTGISPGGSAFPGLTPSVLSSDGSIRESISMSLPGSEARATFSHVNGQLLTFDFRSEGTAKGSAARRQQFETLLLRVLRLDNVPAADQARVVDALCRKNPQLEQARDRFMNAESGTAVATNVPPQPSFA